MARIPWTDDERETLDAFVATCTTTYQFNRKDAKKVNWFMVAKIVNQNHGNDRSHLGCQGEYYRIKREEKKDEK